MKNVMKNKSSVILGSLGGICLLGTVAFANPSMVPDHPGYPMKESKSPVSGVSTANDPGRENLYGQKALEAATKEYTEDLKTRRSGVPGANESESQNQMGDRSQMGGQEQMTGQEHMTKQNQTTGQRQNEGHNQMGGQGQIKSQSQSGMESGNSMEGQNPNLGQ
ncbi:hypothetical protein [Candidatus Nitrospira neomarina]|uniref:Uncharacterized protein n=1 Tax=Candidatus Nitrospira neomarina TaxID=3020899 RepID=A0AA96GK90_9BACT|nr:hypothetical protein [Candidatus Nitrospira neomarina]WNM60543.1 hypothetical protein PQG83_12310 [Candidatus Nitrospira neomarina]